MPIILSPPAVAAKLRVANLSGYPTADPGSGKPWLNGGVLGVGPMPAIEFVSRCLAGNTGIANTIQMQADVDLVNALGGGTILMPRGEFVFNGAFANPFESGGNERDYCVRWKSKVFLKGLGYETVISWEDNALTDVKRKDMFLCAAITNFGFSDIRFDGNTAGNSTLYTGGYASHQAAGTLIAIGCDTNQGIAGANFECFLTNLLFTDTYWYGVNSIKTTTAILHDIRHVDCGAGLEFIYYDFIRVRGFDFRTSDVNKASDDPGEFANGSHLDIDGFYIQGHSLGSSLDITGRGVHVRNGTCDGGNNGPVVQSDGANPALPNSDDVTLSNVTSKNFSASGQDGFTILINDNGSPGRININDCHAINCNKGFTIAGQPPNKGVGDVRMSGSTSRGHGLSGAYISRVSKVSIQDSRFTDGLTNAYGILLFSAGDTALGQTSVEIDGVQCNRNGRFGVFVEQGGTHPPQGYVKAHCEGNLASASGYFGVSTIGAQMYCEHPTATGLELTNTATQRYMTELASDKWITGDQRLYWNYAKVSYLRGGKHDQIVELRFNQQTRVEDVSQGGTRNIVTADGASVLFTVRDSIRLQYSATTQLWYEIGRRLSVFTPFAPTALTGFRSWYKSDSQLWQNDGKTVAAAVTDDPVRRWAVASGTGPDFAAASDGVRPLRDALGGIKGNGTDRFMASVSSVNLSGPYTIIVRHRSVSSLVDSAWLGCWTGAAGWGIRSVTSSADTSQFYENVDPSAFMLSTATDVDVVVAVAVASDGTTTLWRPGGTSISGGNTARSATSDLWALANIFGNTPAIKPTRDIIIMDALITANEFANTEGYFA